MADPLELELHGANMYFSTFFPFDLVFADEQVTVLFLGTLELNITSMMNILTCQFKRRIGRTVDEVAPRPKQI